MNINELPYDIISHIYNNLDIISKINYSLSCKYNYKFFKTNGFILHEYFIYEIWSQYKYNFTYIDHLLKQINDSKKNAIIIVFSGISCYLPPNPFNKTKEFIQYCKENTNYKIICCINYDITNLAIKLSYLYEIFSLVDYDFSCIEILTDNKSKKSVLYYKEGNINNHDLCVLKQLHEKFNVKIIDNNTRLHLSDYLKIKDKQKLIIRFIDN